MPARVMQNGDGTWRVVTPNMTHAKRTTRAKALAQQRLLNMIDHGGKVWKRHGKKKGGSSRHH